MIYRGTCSFADKVGLRERFNRVLDNVHFWYAQVAFAQKAGAKGAVIINNGEALMRMPAGWMKFTEDVRLYQHQNINENSF